MGTRRFSVLLTGAVVALSAALPADVAATAGGTCNIFSANSAKVLDVAGASTSKGARLIQWEDNGGVNQFFRLDVLSGTPYVAIASVQTNNVLDVAGASTADGAPVILWPQNGGDNQVWAPVFSGKVVVFINVHSGKVLDVAGASKADGAPIIQWTWNGGANQFFIDGGECVPPVPPGP